MSTTATTTETPAVSLTDQYLDAWERETKAKRELNAYSQRLKSVADSIVGTGTPYSIRGYFRPESLDRPVPAHYQAPPTYPTWEEMQAAADRLLQAEADKKRLAKEMGPEKVQQLDTFQRAADQRYR